MDPNQENNATQDSIPEPSVAKKSRLSIFWIIPVLTVAIAGWLAYQTLSERGPLITVTFKTSQGLEAGKTKVKYRGVEVGEIEKIRIGKAMSGVVLDVRMAKEAGPHLTDGSRFWVVQPEIGVGGISGLGTLISGNYIAIEPGEGTPARHYQGLEETPIDTGDHKGRRFVLRAETLGSVSVGSAIYFRGIAVGEVERVKIAEDHGVAIYVLVDARHQKLVRENSRFWNISGVNVDLNNILNASVEVSSVKSLIAGGIAFATPKPAGTEAKPGQDFKLGVERPREIGEAKFAKALPIHLKAAQAGSLDAGDPVSHRGLQIGEVVSVDLAAGGIEARAAVYEKHAHLVRVDSLFWDAGGLDLSLASLLGSSGQTTSLKTLLQGGVTIANPTKAGARAKPGAVFKLLSHRPAVLDQQRSLHITLVAERLAGIKAGDGVTYRGFAVGRIDSVKLAENGDAIEISATIDADHAGLVRTNTVFWNASGLTFKAGDFLDASLKIDSLASLVAGGISFSTPEPSGSAARSGTRYTLAAEEPGALKKTEGAEKSLEVVLVTDVAGSVKADDPVLFREFQVGKVSGISLGDNADTVRIQLAIENRYAGLIKTNTVFWNASGLHANFGLFSGVSIDVESMSALLRGGVALATPKKGGKAAKTGTVFPLHDRPKDEWKSWAPHIRLPDTATANTAPRKATSVAKTPSAPGKTGPARPPAPVKPPAVEPIPTTVMLPGFGDSVRTSAVTAGLRDLGFQNVGNVVKSGAIIHAEANWQGRPLSLVIDARDGDITARRR